MGVFLYSNQKIDQEKVKYIFKTRGHKKYRVTVMTNIIC